MEKEAVQVKAKKLISAIRNGEIIVDKRPNHGNDFFGGLEQLHKKNFDTYLGSCNRYLENKRMKEIKYHG